MARVQYFECIECGRSWDGREAATWCGDCQRPILARYDLEPLSGLSLSRLQGRRPDLWRYQEVLPLEDGEEPLSLGEGWTPLVRLPRLGQELGLELLAKQEAFNPTGSFKDRGMSVALHVVRRRGETMVRLPSAGNAASSASAYAARAGLHVTVAMPTSTPRENQIECAAFGARLHTLEGSIRDCGLWLAREAPDAGLDLSTLKEPFRLEGKKTMGYELWEQGQGTLPDVVVYPTGGGTGLIGMGKAFDELECAGLLLGPRPRMVVVQAEGCAPIVNAFAVGLDQADPVAEPHTLAAGLRVPGAIGDRMILSTVRQTGGTCVAVSDQAILEAARKLAMTEGILASTEAAATLAALTPLRESGFLRGGERLVLFLTASGLKSLDAYRT